MKIGLIDVDGHAKKKKFGATIYPNLALCKIAGWHKEQGDEVVWYDPMYTGHCDKVYISKVFNFTPDIDFYIDADEVIKGGTGYDATTKLPDEIDRARPDYDIYPLLPKDTAYGFLTRGCPNKCKWCVVPRKEGGVRAYMDIDEIATPERKKIVLMDNNILAAGDYAKEQLLKIIDKGYRVDFNQAMDARLVTDEFAKLLAQVKWIDSRIRFGCDTPGQIKDCERAMEMINGYGYKGQYFLYTMLNDNFEECYSRINHWWKKNQELVAQHHKSRVYPYAQPYRDPFNPARPIPQWQKDLKRYPLRTLSLARESNVKHILKHKQMSNKKPITGSVKEFKPLTAEERQEQAVRMYVQKRESIATGVLFNLMHNPELLKDDEFTPEGIADAAIKIADKMIEKLYFDKGE